MRGMCQIHAMSADILQVLFEEGDPEPAMALVVQFQKDGLQMSLDRGDWTSGILLWSYPNHWARPSSEDPNRK